MKKENNLLATLLVLSFVLICSCASDDVEQVTLSTTVSPSEGGTVSPSEGRFNSGAEVTITAIAADGYAFKNWLGGISGAANPATFTIFSDKDVVAIFEKQDTDQDGVSDDTDLCPGTPTGQEVDENGCASAQKDSDADGVNDVEDRCPETPFGTAVDGNGCADSQKDSDGDGITDDLDQCQHTAEGETVDAFGCSENQVDSDRDTLTDDLDQCPDTPVGEAIDAQGCSQSQKDDDNDGVKNDKDLCPETPAGETVDANGCSEGQKDADGDGVQDAIDACPGTPTGETADANGCAPSQTDTDADGVKDNVDLCPNTPSGIAVDGNGCAESQIDTDNDGVNDDVDLCPNTPSGIAVDGNGCAESQKDSDADGVYDDKDVCPDTPSGEAVDAEGCSGSQSDKTPPNVASITVTNVTSASFQVTWTLDEGSKGYIRFGTSSGVYVGATAIENTYRTSHIQTVGGTNPGPLLPGTVYYWQIYVEDAYGNTGFSEEQMTTTTTEVSRTYVPDDAFEQNLIDLGYDDVLDDYVVTANINGITSLQLGSGIQIANPYFIFDFTGLEAFKALEDLRLTGLYIENLSFSENTNLKNLTLSCTDADFLDVSGNILLEELRLYGDETSTGCGTHIGQIIGLENAVSLKVLEFALASATDMQGIINSAKSVEHLSIIRVFNSLMDSNGNYVVSLVHNSKLKKINFNAGMGGISPYFVDLRNGANEVIESIVFNDFAEVAPTTCIQAEVPAHIQGVISSTSVDTSLITVTNDCGY